MKIHLSALCVVISRFQVFELKITYYTLQMRTLMPAVSSESLCDVFMEQSLHIISLPTILSVFEFMNQHKFFLPWPSLLLCSSQVLRGFQKTLYLLIRTQTLLIQKLLYMFVCIRQLSANMSKKTKWNQDSNVQKFSETKRSKHGSLVIATDWN